MVHLTVFFLMTVKAKSELYSDVVELLLSAGVQDSPRGVVSGVGVGGGGQICYDSILP